MRRVATAAMLAAGFALVATGCGVQSTGVHVAQAYPFSATGSTSSQAPSQSEAPYQMVLYFIPASNGLPRQTIRNVSQPTKGIDDLLQQLKFATEGGLTTWVPKDLQLIPTSNAHQYTVSTEGVFNSYAQDQVACTFSYYWRQHRDKGAAPSVSFVLPNGVTTGWNDCAYELGSADSKAVAPNGG